MRAHPRRSSSPSAAARRCAALAAAVALALGVAGPAVLAAGGEVPGFAEAFARARLVVVATVQAAPPESRTVRLAVERSLKGGVEGTLSIAGTATSVALVPGSRIVLMAMDPGSLDFRGTTALVVGTDGTIDPDGLAGVPPTVDALVAAYGGGFADGGTTRPGATTGAGSASPTASAIGTTAETPTAQGGTGAAPPGAAVLALAAVLAGAAALIVAIRARRRRA